MDFWGVVTDKGEKLDGTVPEKLQIDDLRIEGYYIKNKYSESFHM